MCDKICYERRIYRERQNCQTIFFRQFCRFLVYICHIHSAVISILNAFYFKASWEDNFQEALTKKEPYKMLNSVQKTVDMMHRKDNYKYFDDAKLGVQYLEIQYASREASFLIIFPKAEGGLRDVERKLNKDVFSRLALQAKPNTLQNSVYQNSRLSHRSAPRTCCKQSETRNVSAIAPICQAWLLNVE